MGKFAHAFHAANNCAAVSILDCIHYSIASLLLMVSRSTTVNGENPDNTNKFWSTLFGEKKSKRPNLFVTAFTLASYIAGVLTTVSLFLCHPPRPSVRNIKPDDLVLPRPPISVEGYNTVILSWVAAMKYVGMSKYSEDLTYSDDVPESMNDASLEDGVVEPLPRRVEEIFREFKMNLSQGVVRRRRIQ